MPISANPLDKELRFSRIHGIWPKWKQVIFTGDFSTIRVDSTYRGNGDTEIYGGDFDLDAVGTSTFDRWVNPLTDVFNPANALDFAPGGGAWSRDASGGGLYTQTGTIVAPTAITGTSGYSIYMAYDWATYPAISSGDLNPLGLPLLRGVADGKLMRGNAGGTGFGPHWSFIEESVAINNAEEDYTIESTTLQPQDFDLEDLTSTRTFEKTRSFYWDQHPTAADNPGTGFYPIRGLLTVESTVSIQIQFIV